MGALIIAIDMEVVEERDGIMGEFRGLMEKAVGAEEGGKLEYAYDGAPSLPGEWTYARPDPSHPVRISQSAGYC